MSESLKDFIARRRSELDAAEVVLQQQIDAIVSERAQLLKAALAAGIEVVAVAGQAREGPSQSVPRSARVPEKSIKEAVIEILTTQGKGMTAIDMLAEINQKFGTAYPRTSLSPQLSRLKNDGKIRRKGTIWRLAKCAPDKIEASDPNLFQGEGSKASNVDPEAQGVKASPGGGT